MKIIAFWDIAPCSLVEIDRRFRGVYCLHQGDGLWRQYASLKRRSTSVRLHGAVFQKAIILIYQQVHVGSLQELKF
jgi:hypothetical protein